MPGCSPYADEFKSQEIDGQALMLLKEDHLMTTMNMKLGPALKICAKINAFRGDLSQTLQNMSGFFTYTVVIPMTTEMLLYCTNQYDPGMDDFNLFVDICKFYLKCVCFYLVC